MFPSDLRYAVRALRKAPGVTAVAVATLALGIGATTAIFTVVHGILLSPLAYPEADRLVALATRLDEGRVIPRVTGGDFVDLREATRAFDAVGYYFGGEVGVQLPGSADFAPVYWTTADFFRVFSARPSHGRLFTDAEVDNAAVVAEPFATRHFGTPAAALDRLVNVENRSYRIVGVLPAAFTFPARAQVWVPAGATPSNLRRSAYNYQAVARRRAGVSPASAQAELDTIGARLAQAHPDTNRQKTFVARALADHLVGSVRPTLRLLFGAVLLVLLIACANTANLMLARAVSRARESAVRLSLGASRWRLIRPLFAEGLVLAVLGGTAGVLLAIAGTRLLVRVAPQTLPRADAIQVDWTIVGFTALVSLAACAIFSLAPAVQGLFIDPQTALTSGGSRTTGGASLHRLRSALVMAEIGLAFALVVAAGLLVRSLVAMQGVALGYETDRTLVMYAHAPARTLDESIAANRFFDDLLVELRAVPGVRAAASVMGLPGGQYGSNGGYAVEGRQVFGSGVRLPQADFTLTSPGYFAALGIPLLRGRDFDARDRTGAPDVAIISESLARQSFGTENPLGQRIICGLDSPDPMTVIGVVADVRRHPPAEPPGPSLYMPLAQHPFRANEIQVVLRTSVPPESLVDPVRRLVQGRRAEVAMKFTTFERILDDAIAAPRFRTLLFVAFGLLSLALAAAGVYAVMAYVAAQRTSEFGVRIALGARPADLVTLMLGRAARLAAGGLAAGVLVAVGVSRVAESLLFEVTPLDATTFGLAGAVLLMLTLTGASVPAWRASRTDPVTAMRTE